MSGPDHGPRELSILPPSPPTAPRRGEGETADAREARTPGRPNPAVRHGQGLLCGSSRVARNRQMLTPVEQGGVPYYDLDVSLKAKRPPW